ncbi:UNVERIFIED_CONTAM: hypothetical protein PYX00_002046 [Menopon gallinae]|uniref:Uncharacterized protein n=1 Tax=Menopon gallinae TaxID=328185 RepID=A0AAW2IGI7_9NEOP
MVEGKRHFSPESSSQGRVTTKDTVLIWVYIFARSRSKKLHAVTASILKLGLTTKATGLILATTVLAFLHRWGGGYLGSDAYLLRGRDETLYDSNEGFLLTVILFWYYRWGTFFIYEELSDLNS